MRIRDVLLRVMGSMPSTSLRAAWGVCVLLLGMPLALDAQASTLAGTRISNEATLQYQDADGTPITLTSNPITLVVAQVAGVDLRLPGSAQVLPGGTAVFPHVLRNLGNGNDTYVLNSQLPSGWEITLYADLDGDGLLSATDTLLNGPITLNARAVVRILAAVQVPASVSPGVSESITLTACPGEVRQPRPSLWGRFPYIYDPVQDRWFRIPLRLPALGRHPSTDPLHPRLPSPGIGVTYRCS